MVRLYKSQLPSNITIKSEQDYRSGEVFEILLDDCYGKCYICEDKPTAINVEHRVPHRGDIALKFDWQNLFIACNHCNKIKSDKYDAILDPTKCDPEEHIALTVDFMDSLIDNVQVTPLTTNGEALQTAELLKNIYNGEATKISKYESSNLRNKHLIPDISRFYQYLRNHRKEPDLGYANIIKKEIDRSSAFAAIFFQVI